MKGQTLRSRWLAPTLIAVFVGTISAATVAAETSEYKIWTTYSPEGYEGKVQSPIVLRSDGGVSGIFKVILGQDRELSITKARQVIYAGSDMSNYFKLVFPDIPPHYTKCKDYIGKDGIFNNSIAEIMASRGFQQSDKLYPQEGGGYGQALFVRNIFPGSDPSFNLLAIEHNTGRVISTASLSPKPQSRLYLGGQEILSIECDDANSAEMRITHRNLVNNAEVVGMFTGLDNVTGPISLRVTYRGFLADIVPATYMQSEPLPLPSLDSPPLANAGVDQSAAEGSLVQLDGSASTVGNGGMLSYNWEQIATTSDDAPITIINANTATPTFIAPTVAVGGKTLTFKLTVLSNDKSATDEVNVAITNLNHVPVAEVGGDQQVAEGSLVTLDGSASFDSDGDLLTYTWYQNSGTPVTLSDVNAISPTFSAPVIPGGEPGATDPLTFTLTVDDNNPADLAAPGYTKEDQSAQVIVTVTNTNNPPVADAGQDIIVNEHNLVTLNGSASNDPDGDAPLSFSWIQLNGPVVNLSNPHVPAPSFTTPYVGAGGLDIDFMLTVSDPFGGMGMAPVKVRVQNENDPPLASAARASVSMIWPPDHRLVNVGVVGVSDPNENARITINKVMQDEPTNGLGDGDTPVDAVINADGTVMLRAERSGRGDGRVYTIYFTAADEEGSDSGKVMVSVPKTPNKPAVNSATQFDSTQ